MTAKLDPLRLKTDPNASPWLRSTLSQAQAQAARGLDIERLTARVEAAIVAPPGPDVPPTTHVGLQKLFASKAAFVGAGVVLGVTLGTAWMLKHASPKTTTAISPPNAHNSLSGDAPLVLPAAAASESSTFSAPGPAASSNPPLPVRDTRSTAPTEAGLLAIARAALSQDPRRALALTQEHARRFPQGALSQEREVIAIEALSRLGQLAAARKRASDFQRAYPGSAHQQKVDQATRGY